MYAVVLVGNTQFKVSEGDRIDTDRIDEKEGKSIKLDKVLLFAKGNDVRIGHPFLKDVKVEAEVAAQHADKKVIAMKYRIRKNSARTVGQRHLRTTLNITKITA